MEETAYWEEKYRAIFQPALPDTLTGFNTNLDQVIIVDRDLLDSPVMNSPVSAELKKRLLNSMKYCRADEWFVTDLRVYTGIIDTFNLLGTLRIGGQAGISATHLARLGVRKVVCASPGVGPMTRKILKEFPAIELPFTDKWKETCDTVHLVFEYPPGLVPVAEGVVPRSNRFIVSPVHQSSSVLLPDASFRLLNQTILTCRRAFLSGYQYLTSREEFVAASRQMEMIKNARENRKIHVECVTVPDPVTINGFLHYILPFADSAGMNENELDLVLRLCDKTRVNREARSSLRPEEVVEGAIQVCRTTGLSRLHVHTFGYYVVILTGDKTNPEKSLPSLLYSSKIVAESASGDSCQLSRRGLDALKRIARIYRPGTCPGVFWSPDFHILVIPTIIAENVRKTSGFGDIISSTAFVTDPNV